VNWALGAMVLVILLIIVAAVRFVMALLKAMRECDEDFSR
jgi:hypothetical protein